jgi:hypothetical protein
MYLDVSEQKPDDDTFLPFRVFFALPIVGAIDVDFKTEIRLQEDNSLPLDSEPTSLKLDGESSVRSEKRSRRKAKPLIDCIKASRSPTCACP